MTLKINLIKIIKKRIPNTIRKQLSFFMVIIPAILLFSLAFTNTSCNIYKFTEASPVPDSIKTVRINQFLNRARYVNVQLSPKLTDKLRQKIVGQTKLVQTNNEDADWEISGTITEYNLSTSAISGQKEVNNRLTVGVRIILNRRKEELVENYDVSRSFEFSANQSLQQAESSLSEEIVRSLTDEIFNKIFSKW